MIMCHLKGQSTLKSRIHIVIYSVSDVWRSVETSVFSPVSWREKTLCLWIRKHVIIIDTLQTFHVGTIFFLYHQKQLTKLADVAAQQARMPLIDRL